MISGNNFLVSFLINRILINPLKSPSNLHVGLNEGRASILTVIKQMLVYYCCSQSRILKPNKTPLMNTAAAAAALCLLVLVRFRAKLSRTTSILSLCNHSMHALLSLSLSRLLLPKFRNFEGDKGQSLCC